MEWIMEGYIWQKVEIIGHILRHENLLNLTMEETVENAGYRRRPTDVII